MTLLPSAGAVEVPPHEPRWARCDPRGVGGRVVEFDRADMGRGDWPPGLPPPVRADRRPRRLDRTLRRAGTVVEGSVGQARSSPLFEQRRAIDAEARQLEDRFGLSPLARSRLGYSYAEATRSLESPAVDSTTPDEAVDDDPRLDVIDGEAFG